MMLELKIEGIEIKLLTELTLREEDIANNETIQEGLCVFVPRKSISVYLNGESEPFCKGQVLEQTNYFEKGKLLTRIKYSLSKK
jgi:hypothetical protein